MCPAQSCRDTLWSTSDAASNREWRRGGRERERERQPEEIRWEEKAKHKRGTHPVMKPKKTHQGIMFGSPHINLLLARKPALSPFSLSFLNDLHPSSDLSVRPFSSAQLNDNQRSNFPSCYLFKSTSKSIFVGEALMERLGRQKVVIVLCFSMCVFVFCVCIHEHVELHASLNVDGLYRNTQSGDHAFLQQTAAVWSASLGS